MDCSTHSTIETKSGLCFSVFALAFLFSSAAGAQDLTIPQCWSQCCWTTVGFTGTVDEDDIDVADLSGDHIAVDGDVESAEVDIRYNILGVAGVLARADEEPDVNLTARLVDNGEEARVTVEVRELNLASGRFETLMELDSNDFDPHFQAQERSLHQVDREWDLDFGDNVYYVAVTLEKTGPDGNPLIRGLSLCAERH